MNVVSIHIFTEGWQVPTWKPLRELCPLVISSNAEILKQVTRHIAVKLVLMRGRKARYNVRLMLSPPFLLHHKFLQFRERDLSFFSSPVFSNFFGI